MQSKRSKKKFFNITVMKTIYALKSEFDKSNKRSLRE